MRQIVLSTGYSRKSRTDAAALTAGVRLTKTQELAVKRVHRSIRWAGGHKTAQSVRGVILLRCAEPFQGQGGQTEEQTREAGGLLGRVTHRWHHHVDGQELLFSSFGCDFWRENPISRHNGHDVLI